MDGGDRFDKCLGCKLAGPGDTLAMGASRITPRLLPWVTGWVPFTKNGDIDTSSEKKTYIWGVLYLRGFNIAKRRCSARN